MIIIPDDENISTKVMAEAQSSSISANIGKMKSSGWIVLILWVSLILANPQITSATPLGDLAKSMQPGTWAELVTNNIAVLKDCSGGGQGQMIPYAEGMKWDPASKKAWYFGSDDPINCAAPNNFARFISYDEETNTWSIMPTPPWVQAGFHYHQYDAFPIDASKGILYFAHAAGGHNYKYNIASGTWTEFPALGGYACCESMEYFPEMKALIHVRVGEVWRFNDGANGWTLIKGGFLTSYHSVSEYNPVHKVMVFGGTGSNFYKLNSSGQITTLKPPPVPLSINIMELTYDPVSGDYLYMDYKQDFYSYNVVTDTWTPLSIAGAPTDIFRSYALPDQFSTLATPISAYGVVMFTECRLGGTCKVYLYKHSPTPVDTTPPSAPQNLGIR